MDTRTIKNTVKRIMPKPLFNAARSVLQRWHVQKIAAIHPAPFEQEAFPKGINVAGYFQQESGLGQSSRLLAKGVEATGIPHTYLSADLEGLTSDSSFTGKIETEFNYGVNLFCVNMGDFYEVLSRYDRSVFDKHYNIAFWLWELDTFPKEWIPYIDVLDEVWTPSEFVSDAIRKVTDKPVTTIPYAIEAPVDEQYDRKYFGLPEDKFLFLMMYDSNSIAERKNPMGVIEAFRKAFNKDDNVGLVIKMTHGTKEEVEYLEKLLEGYPIYLMPGVRSKVEVNSLIKAVDVYVSLHRGEGFGLVPAEAMYLGTPVIATRYSATLDFQDDNCACLVDYELVPIGKDLGPYKKENHWADPNLDQAAEYMKKLYNDPDYYKKIRENGKKQIDEVLSVGRVKGLIQKRLGEIYGSLEGII